MQGLVPRPQMPIVLESDGIRRLASSQRQLQPTRIIAVLERSAFTRDSNGQKHAYVPFAAQILLNGHLAQRSERGLGFDFAVTLCDSVSRPLVTLTGTAENGKLDVAILDVIAKFTETSRITTPASIDLLVPNRDKLGLIDLAVNSVFCLNPPWQHNAPLDLISQANEEALAPLRRDYRSQSSIVAYTDGSLPHHGRDRSAGAMVTQQGHWATQVSPKQFSRNALMAETTGALLAMHHVPEDANLMIVSDCRALVKAVNDIALGNACSKKAHHLALQEHMELRTGKTRATWVRGHNGNKYNEAVDRMAVLMARHYNAGIDPLLTQSLMRAIVAEELSGLAMAA